MKLSIHATPDDANRAAASLLAGWLAEAGVRNVMLAAGNTPLALYGLISERRLPLGRLNIFALDEYAGVPPAEPRNCASLIRRAVVEPWGIAPGQYHTVSSLESSALESVLRHERRLEESGGLDVIVLGLGQNGHLGFNEPGSSADCGARVLDLDPISTEANRQWFGGDYAPSRGATVGMRTILSARGVLLLAFGAHKAAAAQAMLEGPATAACPASWLQQHASAHVFLDAAAAGQLSRRS
jgi:6-phosphogluconolactonase/glucosamine-6-phosphate isomerase/deaminase